MMIVAIIVLTAVAAGLFVVTFSIIFGRREAVLERRLAGYELVPAVDPKVAPGTPETAIVQQAVDLTGRFAERAGFLTRVERALESGDIPVRASELMFYTVAGAVAGGLFFALLLGPLLGVVCAAVIGILPAAYVSNKQRARTKSFERQLPDTLALLASSLRAGFSFMQGLETVSQEIGEPMRRELQRVFTEVRLGRQVEDALADAAERMNSKDLAWTVMAIKIQREVGGNLAVLLDTVADTMLKRERLRREISALTAEGRISSIILGLVPPVVAVGLLVLAPDYIGALFESFAGWAAVVVAAILMVVGGLWLRKLVNIEV